MTHIKTYWLSSALTFSNSKKNPKNKQNKNIQNKHNHPNSYFTNCDFDCKLWSIWTVFLFELRMFLVIYFAGRLRNWPAQRKLSAARSLPQFMEAEHLVLILWDRGLLAGSLSLTLFLVVAHSPQISAKSQCVLPVQRWLEVVTLLHELTFS